MTSSIFDLGEDIILYHVVPQLSLKDIEAMSLIPNHRLHLLLTTSFFYQVLFKKKFSQDNSTPMLDSNVINWKKLVQLRNQAHLYTWGSNEQARLGYGSRRNDEIIDKPKKLEDLDATITNFSAGGFGFNVITSKGNIFSTGLTSNKSTPGPDEPDFDPVFKRIRSAFTRDGFLVGRRPTRSIPNATLDERQINPDKYYDKEVVEEIKEISKNNFITYKYIPRTPSNKNSQVIDISSGRTHFMVLDSSNQIWTWDAPGQIIGVKVGFYDKLTKENILKNRTVSKIAAGWGLSSCYLINVGILVWNSRENIKKSDSLDFAVETNYRIVPGTKNNVVDYMLGSGFLIYINQDGQLLKLKISDNLNIDSILTETAENMIEFNDILHKHEGEKYKKITGCYNHFAVFTNADNLYLGDTDSTKPKVFKGLQKRNIINIAMGDYHNLGLTSDGKMLSWGREPRSCGCLGQGNKWVNALFKVDRMDCYIEQPQEVSLPEGCLVLGITAAGWHSGAIIAETGTN